MRDERVDVLKARGGGGRDEEGVPLGGGGETRKMFHLVGGGRRKMFHLVGGEGMRKIFYLVEGGGGEGDVPFLTSPMNLTHSFRLIKVLMEIPHAVFCQSFGLLNI